MIYLRIVEINNVDVFVLQNVTNVMELAINAEVLAFGITRLYIGHIEFQFAATIITNYLKKLYSQMHCKKHK